MNQGKYVFNQLTDFLPQRILARLIDKYDGNKYVKFFSCWNQLSCMLFGQLSGRESLRDLMIGLKAQEIALLYKYRWNVELFFKWVKQDLKIKSFRGTTPNAVKIQIYPAIIIYCLVAIASYKLKAESSPYEILQILSISLFDKI